MTLSPDQQKQRLRQRAHALRRELLVGDGAERLARNFLGAMQQMDVEFAEATVAGYWPLGDELDVRPLLARLHARGVVCALPVVAARDAALLFRRWHPDMPLHRGLTKCMEPGPAADEVIPDVVLVPLLAFDRQGYRLGWGGGYYDRTLEALRQRRRVVAVGTAFAGQEVDNLPRGPHDQPVDWMVTEVKATRMDGG